MPGRDQLQQLLANLRALGARRLALLAGVGVIITSIVGIGSYLASRPDYETLYIGLSAQDVSRIGMSLREAGLDFDVSADGSKIMVRRGRAAAARMLLAEKGLPSSATSGYELFDKVGPMGLTSFMQEVTRLRALEGEIARTIQTMRGVKAARAHIVIPDNSTLRRSRQQAAASVVIRVDRSYDSNSSQAIRHLVAAAVPGLTSDQVTVISADGNVLASGESVGQSGATKMMELEKLVAAEIRENIRRTLLPYVGASNFEISVSARLNLDRKQTSETTFDPDSKAERSRRSIREQGSSQNMRGRANTSVEQNIPVETASIGASPDQSRKSSEKRDELTNYELSSRTIATVSDGYKIENVTVALVLNRKQLAAQGAATPPDGALEARIRDIEQLVSAAAGLDTRRGDRVTITAVDFTDSQPEPVQSSVLADVLSQQAGNLINAAAAILLAVLLVWFGMRPLVSAIRDAPAKAVTAEPAIALAEPKQVSAQSPHLLPAGESASAEPAGKKLEGAVARSEDQVAAILRQWLKDA